MLAGGISPPYNLPFARAVVQAISQRPELNHLFLDAERTYGPVGCPGMIRSSQLRARIKPSHCELDSRRSR